MASSAAHTTSCQAGFRACQGALKTGPVYFLQIAKHANPVRSAKLHPFRTGWMQPSRLLVRSLLGSILTPLLHLSFSFANSAKHRTKAEVPLPTSSNPLGLLVFCLPQAEKRHPTTHNSNSRMGHCSCKQKCASALLFLIGFLSFAIDGPIGSRLLGKFMAVCER